MLAFFRAVSTTDSSLNDAKLTSNFFASSPMLIKYFWWYFCYFVQSPLCAVQQAPSPLFDKNYPCAQPILSIPFLKRTRLLGSWDLSQCQSIHDFNFIGISSTPSESIFFWSLEIDGCNLELEKRSDRTDSWQHRWALTDVRNFRDGQAWGKGGSLAPNKDSLGPPSPRGRVLKAESLVVNSSKIYVRERNHP